MQSNQKLSILIIGGSGNLGSLITREALKHNNLNVNVMFHSGSNNKDLMEMVKKSGGKVFEGDIRDKNSFRDITKGMHTVISALIGGDDVIIDGQKALLEDAERNGVERFVPSDYSFDIWNIPKGKHFFTDQRLIFKEILDKSKVKGLHFSNGMFMETYFWMVNKCGGICYYGDINQKMDLISQEDLAKFIIAAIMDKTRTGHVKVVGVEMSTKEIVDTYNKVLGKKEQAKYMGTVDDLKKKVMELREQGKLFDSIQLGYEVVYFDGSGKIMDKMNSLFPEITPMTLEQFLQATQGKPDYNYSVPEVVNRCEKQIMTH